MNRISTSALVLLVGFTLSAHAQLAWHQGEVVPTTGIRLWGELCYQPRTHSLLFRTTAETPWRTYPADQLRQFSYMDAATNGLHHIGTYDVPMSTGQTITLLFEELIPGATVPLLQLVAPNGLSRAARRVLPRMPKAAWQTEHPRYVWLDGRLLAPDVFVETELDGLLATTPTSVQQWAKRYPRPTDPKSLGRWLAYFDREMANARSAQPVSPTIVTGR
jgi:hypothetical protein